MAIVFNRQQVEKWQKLNEIYSINWASHIGSGSYGVVFKGYSKEKDTLVAIKVVKSNQVSKRQIETLKLLSSLNHPNIMGFYGDLTKDQNTFLFLEYCNKGTLDSFITRGIPQLLVLKLFRQIVEGMCYMNAKQKMHRDFKPQNILIGPEDDAKICDFGLSQGTNSIFVTGKLGTPFYAAPQVYLLKNNNYSYNCDVWSCGLILYQMLTQNKLFQSVTDYDQLKQQWLCYQRGLKHPKLKKQLHPLWEYFLNWMIQFDPQKRPHFHLVLQNLKKVYKRMKDNIQGNTSMINNLHLQQADSFITFQISKHQILLNLCEKFTKQDIRIYNQFKYVSMFMCLLRYTLFVKEFIRALSYKRLKHQGKQLLNNSQEYEAEIQFFCDKNRFVLEHRLRFYSKQLKQTVVSRIQNVYQKRKQSQEIMKELSEVRKLIGKYTRGEVIQNNQQLCQIFQNILIPLRKKHKDYRKLFKQDELRLYAYLLTSMLLEQKFPQSQYRRLDVQSEIKKLYQKSQQQLQKYVESMHDQICN